MCTEATADEILDDVEQKSGLVSIDDLLPGDMVKLTEEGHVANGNVYLKTTVADGLLVNLTNRGMSHIGQIIGSHVKRFVRLNPGETITLTQK